MVPPRHQLQRKGQKKFDDYSQKLIDYFKLIVVNPSPKLTNQEKRSIATFFWVFLSRPMYWNYHKENYYSCIKSLEWKQFHCKPKYMCIEPIWNCISGDIFNWNQIVFLITDYILPIRVTLWTKSDALYLCWNVTVTCLILTY